MLARIALTSVLTLAAVAYAGDDVEKAAAGLTAYLDSGKTFPATPGYVDYDTARLEFPTDRAAYRFKAGATADRFDAFTAPLLKKLSAATGDERVRLVQVLARLQVTTALPTIRKLAEDDADEKAQLAAVNALGLFGAENRDIGYVTMVRKRVVFPAAPDAEATQVLLRVLARPKPDDAAQVKRWKTLRREALGALRTHTGEDVEAAVAKELASPELRLEALWVLLSSHLAVPVDEVAKLLKTAKEPAVRLSAARALGVSGEQAAIAPLLQALSDKQYIVKSAADEGLGNLLGAQKGRPASKAAWTKRFGKGFSKFDPARACRYEVPPPGG